MSKFVLLIIYSISIFYGALLSSTHANTLESIPPKWQLPTPVFSQKFDWLKLKSDEWLKGDIISMYEDELEFDSDEFGIQTFDWRDVRELRSRYDQNIRISSGKVLKGFLVVKNEELILISNGEEKKYPLSELMSITSAADKRQDLWDGKISLGIDASAGNVNQLDYIMTGRIQRRTAYTRFKSDITYNYSKSTQDEEDRVIADMTRLTSNLDWFYSDKIFFRMFDYEYYSDLQQNIKSKHSIGSSLGYHLINNKRLMWDVTLGPSYQQTTYINSSSDAGEKSGVIALSTLIDYTISSRIDFTFDYQIQYVEEESGKQNSHLKTGVEFEFTNDFEFALFFYLDRIAEPVVDISSVEPEPKSNDYRLVVSLGYDF